MKTHKPATKPDQIEELPDAWKGFETAFDKVMKPKRKPVARKTRGPSPECGGKHGGSKQA